MTTPGRFLTALAVPLALAFGLLSRSTRPWVAPLGFVLHLGIMFTLAITYSA
ncbi:MAG: hypothetical protein HC900_10330 [Methylacidiphilales bacterium]|nr:hypothetical protein [Candidatus Methylacidiphilales bacterium]